MSAESTGSAGSPATGALSTGSSDPQADSVPTANAAAAVTHKERVKRLTCRFTILNATSPATSVTPGGSEVLGCVPMTTEMTWAQTIILSLIQGLTEFLPVSSSGHLRIFSELLWGEDAGASFTAVIQLGTELAVLVFFAKDIWNLSLIHI